MAKMAEEEGEKVWEEEGEGVAEPISWCIISRLGLY